MLTLIRRFVKYNKHESMSKVNIILTYYYIIIIRNVIEKYKSPLTAILKTDTPTVVSLFN